jgi:hypothetical protein
MTLAYNSGTFENKDTCDWDCLNVVPCPQFFVYLILQLGGWTCGSRGRASAWQTQSPTFKLQARQKQTKKPNYSSYPLRRLKMIRALTLPLPTVCPQPCNKSPFSVFTMPLSLAYRDKWVEPVYGIPGVWALGPKLVST